MLSLDKIINYIHYILLIIKFTCAKVTLFIYQPQFCFSGNQCLN